MILYTTPTCTRCKVLKMKLGIKNISYEEIDDEKILQEKGITFAPALEVNGDLLNFEQANNYIIKTEEKPKTQFKQYTSHSYTNAQIATLFTNLEEVEI